MTPAVVPVRGADGAVASRLAAAAAALARAPSLTISGRDAGGAEIAQVRYASVALHRDASFLVYLPPGYRPGSGHRYPVLYLLHGDDQDAHSFLTFGLSATLDRLIHAGAVRPLLAVIPEGGGRPNDWRNAGRMRYEDYVLETQRMADLLLPTVPDRAGRAIAGYSMGGYGAMNIALGHLDRFSVAESWLGFFNGLGGELRTDATRFSRLPLTAFVYGGASDPIVNASQNAPFAAALRGAGAKAGSAVYPGGHNFATLHTHLRSMVLLAARALSSGTDG